MEKVHISETSTDKVPNASPSAASVSTDLYGMAVKNCCDQIMEILKPYREADPSASWEDWVRCIICSSPVYYLVLLYLDSYAKVDLMVEHINVLDMCDAKSHLSAFQFWKKAVLGFVFFVSELS